MKKYLPWVFAAFAMAVAIWKPWIPVAILVQRGLGLLDPIQIGQTIVHPSADWLLVSHRRVAGGVRWRWGIVPWEWKEEYADQVHYTYRLVDGDLIGFFELPTVGDSSIEALASRCGPSDPDCGHTIVYCRYDAYIIYLDGFQFIWVHGLNINLILSVARSFEDIKRHIVPIAGEGEGGCD